MDNEYIGPWAKLLTTFCDERDEAIKERKKQGLDRIWAQAREQFGGIDEVNRPRRLEGAATLDGPLTTMGKVGRESRSTVFVNITRPYTKAGIGRVIDIAFPTGKQGWRLNRPTISDTERLASVLSEYPDIQEFLLSQEEFADLAAKVADPQMAVSAMALAERTIKDFFKETNWINKMRDLIREAGIVGTGVIKGPVSKLRRLPEDMQAFLDALPPHLRALMSVRLLYSPESEVVKVENCYPAAGCGSSINNGDHFFELLPEFSKRQLRRLAEDPTFLTEELHELLEEDPEPVVGAERGSKSGKKSYDLWVRTGYFPEAYLRYAAGEDITEEDIEQSEDVFGVVYVSNKRVLKVARHILPDEDLGYHVLQWEPREGSWTGVGIPEQIETPQRGLNATVRALQDNLGYSVGPQVIEWKGLIKPKDGDYGLYPYKQWEATIDGLTVTIDDVKKALTFLEFPNYTNELQTPINFWLKMAEDTTGLPLILQGQATTDAVGVSQQLQNNALTNLRLVVKNLDEVTEAQVRGYYSWVQEYGPEAARGDAVPEALGSANLIIRELQQQGLIQLLQSSLEPMYGLSPKKLMALLIEGHQLNPEELAMDEEEKAAFEQMRQQPDPAVQVAQIRGEVDKYVADLRSDTERAIAQLKAQIDGMQADQAAKNTETSMNTQVALEAMRQQGGKEKEVIKQVGGQADGQAGGQKGPTAGMASPAEPEMGGEEALRALGLA